MRTQEPPFCVQIELALGCNLACTFCGINQIGLGAAKRSDLKFMTVETAEAVAASIARAGWTARIEFARRGEPTLNPQAANIIAVFRKHLPRNYMMMLTNGGGLLPDPVSKITAMLDAGLNVLAVENYEGIKLHEKIMQQVRSTQTSFKVEDYPANAEANPHKRRPPSTRLLVSVDNIQTATKGTHSKINNHGGYAGELRKYDKPCAKTFREMSVNYDGVVNYCCIAWAGEGVCGNLRTDEATDVWNGPRFDAVRRRLIRGQRDFMTCLGCDHPSERVALLPDKLGKERSSYPLPTAETDAIIKEMEAEGPVIKQGAEYLRRKESF